MPSKLTVPTVFTAVDRLTAVVSRMSRGVTQFADKAQASVSRANRWFNKLTPTLGSASKQLLSFASTAAIAGGIVGGIIFSGKSIQDYEDRVAAFRTVVSDLDDKAFTPYQKMINQVASTTKTSAIEVARSFETITGLNADFAETASGLGDISKAAIILSKASRLDLTTSSEALVGILSQFSLGAEHADRVINVLAAGLKYGSASIADQTEAYKNYGTVAKTSNVTLEQSVGLIQTLAKYQIKGADAGTALRGVTVRLQKANMGYKSGQFNMNDALDETISRLSKYGSQAKKDRALIQLFGLENIIAGKILLNNTELTRKLTKQVSGTDEAHKQAAINMDTLVNRLAQLQAQWVNYITSNDAASKGIAKVKNAVAFLTDHLDTIVSVGASVLTFFAVWKGLIWSAQIALGVYNIALGITGALTGIANVAIGQSPIALAAYEIATGIATAATWLFNTALAANPIVWVAAAIIAGVLAIVYIFYYWDDIVKWFKKTWDGALSGIVGMWNWVVSAISGLTLEGVFRGIGRAIVEYLLFPLKAVLKIASFLPGKVGDAAAKALGGLNSFTAGISVNSDAKDPKQPLGTPQQKSEEITRNNNTNNTLDVNINDPGKNVKSANMKGQLPIPINLTSTQGVR